MPHVGDVGEGRGRDNGHTEKRREGGRINSAIESLGKRRNNLNGEN